MDYRVFLQDNSYRGLRAIAFKLDPDLLTLLDRYAEKRGLSRSGVIREAIARLLAKDSDIEEYMKKAKIERGVKL